ncbi:MAG: ABC transporter permease [Phycisphaerales bacterium]|nr:ABC transporter permease [Phycisphaerales bacterium]
MSQADSPSQTITGIQAFQGEGAPAARGFWADAWDHVFKQPTAVLGLVWVGLVAFMAAFAPLLASGHPIIQWEIDRRTSQNAAEAFEREAGVRLGGASGLTVSAGRLILERELARHADAPRPADLIPGDAAATMTRADVDAASARIRQTAALDATGATLAPTSPLLKHLRAPDWAILVFGVAGVALWLAPSGWVGGMRRSTRLGVAISMGLQAALTVVLGIAVGAYFTRRDAPDWAREMEGQAWFIPAAAFACATAGALLFALVPLFKSAAVRIGVVVGVAAIAGTIVGATWKTPPGSFDYLQRERLGEIKAIYTLLPWSPNQRPSDRDAATLPPGMTHDQALANVVRAAIPPSGLRESTPRDVEEAVRRARLLPVPSEYRDRIATAIETEFGGQSGVSPSALRSLVEEQLRGVGRSHPLGTDSFGQDVLSQILHACRLAISMGLVATGLAVVIGVTMGSLMGYFGGWVDMLLYRVVEMFMAIPVLFLLIVAAGVLPRNTYVMMAIIGCVTWHGAARFTRAEFMKLRSQDFVQSARSVGLPLPSILFKHMLPNGVTPVLVDASFGIAAAILFEAVLSYLGLGPPDQPSWGRVLSDAAGETGTFNWWLGVFPGGAIFLTVLSLTMVGQALRDAIDPKLKKARV